jgi:hypothetical protein
MSNPRLTNLNGTNSTDYLPLWQMPVTYYQALSILITAILVKLNERPLPRFRSLLATACALLPGATVRKTTSLHLQLAYQARSLYSLALAHPFFLASSGEAAGFLFVTERMRLFSAPHPQLSVITHIGGMHTDSVRLMESPVLNTERETHAHNEQLWGCSVT